MVGARFVRVPAGRLAVEVALAVVHVDVVVAMLARVRPKHLANEPTFFSA